MSEYEYYTNSPYTNFCKMEGYLQRFDNESIRLRTALSAYAQYCEGKQTMPQIWHIWGDEGGSESTIPSWADTPQEVLDEIRKSHNAVIKKAHGIDG